MNVLKNREVVRILTNYGRIVCTFAISIIIVRFLIAYDPTVFSTYILVTVGMGFGMMFRELVRIAIVPALGRAYGADDGSFERTYAAGFAISVGLALLAVACMSALYANLHRFAITSEQLPDAKQFVIYRTLQIAAMLSLSPALNLILVTRRYAHANLLLLLERVIECVSVIALLIVFSASGPLAQVGLIAMVLTIALYLITVFGLVMRWDQRFVPRFGLLSGRTLVAIAVPMIWSALLVLTMNLYIRFDVSYVNYALGASATVVFAIAVQAMGMVGQLSQGLISGLDAAVVHMLSRNQSGSDGLVLVSSQLQAAFGGAVIAFFYFCMEDFIAIWVGDVLPDPAMVGLARTVALLLIGGIVIRGISEVWMTSLNAMGLIDRYVRWLLPLAVLNAGFVVGLSVFVLPDTRIEAIAAVFLVLQIIAHALIVPWIYSRETGKDVFRLFRPFALCAVIFAAFVAVVQSAMIIDLTDFSQVTRVVVVFVLSSGLAALVFLAMIRWMPR